MIWRPVLVFLCLFIGYNVAVPHLHVPSTYFQNQWGRNISIAEDYVLDARAHDVVIVGSSLAARLDETDLGPRIANLSFAGGSAATGLYIVSRRDPLPRTVLIEANVLRDLDQPFADARVGPVQTAIRRYLPSARVKYQPINVLLNFMRRHSKAGDKRPNANAFATAFAVQRADAQDVPDPAETAKSVASIAAQARALTDRGVEIVLFRMPVDPAIATSPRSIALKEAFERRFPPATYRWLPDSSEHYETDDGIHLAAADARAFAGRLRRELHPQP